MLPKLAHSDSLKRVLTGSLFYIFSQQPDVMNYGYTIEKSRYGLYTSVFDDGTKGTTALTEEACDFVTRNIRIPVMRGEWDGPTSVVGSAIVGGKL